MWQIFCMYAVKTPEIYMSDRQLNALVYVI